MRVLRLPRGGSIRRALACAFVFALAALASRSAHATTIFVDQFNVNPTVGHCSLLDAITAVNTRVAQHACVAGNGVNDSIQLQAGTYATSTALILTRPVNLRGAGMRSTTISATGITTKCDGTSSLPAAVQVRNTNPVLLSGLTVQGNGTDALAGVCAAGSSVTLVHTDVKSFHAGGVVARRGSGVSLTQSVIESNHSASNGGGIAITDAGSTLFTWGSSIVNNSATGVGGGVYEVGQGGQIQETTISGNSAGTNGGGVYLSLDITNQPYAAFYSDTIVNNHAGAGGGLFATSTNFHIIMNDTIVANNTSNDGNPNLSAGLGNNNLPNITFAYSIFGTASFDCLRCNSDVPLCPSPPTATTCPVNVTAAQLNLGSLASVGGADNLLMHAPGSGSLAIDFHPPNSNTNADFVDARGYSRPRFSFQGDMTNPWFDVGSYEAGTWYVGGLWDLEYLAIPSKSSSGLITVVSTGAEAPWVNTANDFVASGQGVIMQAFSGERLCGLQGAGRAGDPVRGLARHCDQQQCRPVPALELELRLRPLHQHGTGAGGLFGDANRHVLRRIWGRSS